MELRSSWPPPTSGTSSAVTAEVVSPGEVVVEEEVVEDEVVISDVVLGAATESEVVVDSVDGCSADGVAESTRSAPPHAAATRDIARSVLRRRTEGIVRL